MVMLGMGVVWWGYLEILYGWCLLKGYDVTWKQLANPVNPYQWPKPPANPPLIPNTQVLPGAAPSTPATTGAQQPTQKTQSSTLPQTQLL